LANNETYIKGIEDILKIHGMTVADIYSLSADELAAKGFTE
jgi:hypothetical protein